MELSGASETPDIGGTALETLAPAFVSANSAEVDGVSGATFTSDGAKAAVADALNQAMGAEPETEAAETEAAAPETEAEPVVAEGDISVGVGVSYSLKGTDAGEEDGSAQVNALVAAVMVDSNGTILQCRLDAVQTTYAISGEGKIGEDAKFVTKKELGDEYGMRDASPIGKEWFEQADFFEQYVVGKTLADIEGMTLDEQGHPTDTDLLTGVTMKIGSWQEALVKALNNVVPTNASAADGLGLGIVSSGYGNKDAADGEDGACSVSSSMAAVTVGSDGAITSAYIEAGEGKFTFDGEGKITSDTEAGVLTKRELHDDYGMKPVSPIGKEWYEQADAMGEYVIGKTADEVAGIAVDEEGKPTDADLLTGVTITASGFRDAIVKAAEDAAAGVKIGVGVSYSLKGTDAGEEEGSAQVNGLVASVMLDGTGTILQCQLDAIQTTYAISKEGKLGEDVIYITKKELGDDYGMRDASPIGKEWFEQADFFEQYVVGKTLADIEGMTLDEQGHPTDADLLTGVTMKIGAWQEALVKAIKTAVPVNASSSDSLGLGIVSTGYGSKDAADGEDGACSVSSSMAAVTVDADGVITSAYIEAGEGKFTFDGEGKITSDTEADVLTKRELHDDYGMKPVSPIGKEWYEQADAMGEYVIGKTADEVAGIAVDEAGKPTDADLLTGVTITANGFRDAIVKAVENAK